MPSTYCVVLLHKRHGARSARSVLNRESTTAIHHLAVSHKSVVADSANSSSKRVDQHRSIPNVKSTISRGNIDLPQAKCFFRPYSAIRAFAAGPREMKKVSQATVLTFRPNFVSNKRVSLCFAGANHSPVTTLAVIKSVSHQRIFARCGC